MAKHSDAVVRAPASVEKALAAVMEGAAPYDDRRHLARGLEAFLLLDDFASIPPAEGESRAVLHSCLKQLLRHAAHKRSLPRIVAAAHAALKAAQGGHVPPPLALRLAAAALNLVAALLGAAEATRDDDQSESGLYDRPLAHLNTAQARLAVAQQLAFNCPAGFGINGSALRIVGALLDDDAAAHLQPGPTCSEEFEEAVVAGLLAVNALLLCHYVASSQARQDFMRHLEASQALQRLAAFCTAQRNARLARLLMQAFRLALLHQQATAKGSWDRVDPAWAALFHTDHRCRDFMLEFLHSATHRFHAQSAGAADDAQQQQLPVMQPPPSKPPRFDLTECSAGLCQDIDVAIDSFCYLVDITKARWEGAPIEGLKRAGPQQRSSLPLLSSDEAFRTFAAALPYDAKQPADRQQKRQRTFMLPSGSMSFIDMFETRQQDALFSLHKQSVMAIALRVIFLDRLERIRLGGGGGSGGGGHTAAPATPGSDVADDQQRSLRRRFLAWAQRLDPSFPLWAASLGALSPQGSVIPALPISCEAHQQPASSLARACSKMYSLLQHQGQPPKPASSSTQGYLVDVAINVLCFCSVVTADECGSKGPLMGPLLAQSQVNPRVVLVVLEALYRAVWDEQTVSQWVKDIESAPLVMQHTKMTRALLKDPLVIARLWQHARPELQVLIRTLDKAAQARYAWSERSVAYAREVALPVAATAICFVDPDLSQAALREGKLLHGLCDFPDAAAEEAGSGCSCMRRPRLRS